METQSVTMETFSGEEDVDATDSTLEQQAEMDGSGIQSDSPSHDSPTAPQPPASLSPETTQLDTLDPRFISVKGLPYKTRNLESLKELVRQWEMNRRCPHPYCPSKPTSSNALFRHWYSTHMAPGYCLRYQCIPCSAAQAKVDSFKLRSNFLRHLSQQHNVGSDQAELIANSLETSWEKLVNENMLQEPNHVITKVHPENRIFLGLDSNQATDAPDFVAGSAQNEKLPPAQQATNPKLPDSLKWEDLHFKSLTSQWRKKHYRCPHPECSQRERTDALTPLQAFINHWREAHNADLAGEKLACEFCPITVSSPAILAQHLMEAHEMNEGVAASLVYVNIERNKKTKPVTNNTDSPSLSPALSSHSSTESINPIESDNIPSSRNPKRLHVDDTVPVDDDLNLSLEQIPPERREVAGLPWKSFNAEKSAALEKAWFNNSKCCPHPVCASYVNAKKMLFQHWHQRHFLPDCGIPYKCYGRVPESDKACSDVFDNKWDLIQHARNFHQYADPTINLLLSKVKAARDTGKVQEHLPYDGKPPVKKTRNFRYMRPVFNATNTSDKLPASQPPPLEPLSIKVLYENHQVSRKGRGLNAIVEQLHQAKKSPTLTATSHIQPTRATTGLDADCATKQPEHGENSMTSTPLAKSRSSPLTPGSDYVQDKVATDDPSSDQGTTDENENGGMKLYHRVNPNPIVIEPLSQSTENSGISLLSGDLDAELPKAMWRVILNTWRYTLRCPNPVCEQKPVQYFSHAGILAHWLTVHIQAQHRSRLYVCRHGLDSPNSEACHNIFAQPFDLYSHCVGVHGYKKGEANRTVTIATQEWEVIEKQQKKKKQTS